MSKMTCKVLPLKREPKEMIVKNSKITDWSNPQSKISEFFIVKEALFLPSWGVMHNPTDEEKANIIKMAEAMDKIRRLLNTPISVSCWIRPSKVELGQNQSDWDKIKSQMKNWDNLSDSKKKAFEARDYNAFVGGAKASAHLSGMAVDFVAKGMSCDEVRAKLLNKLEEFQIRVEDLPKSNWVHADIKVPPPGGKRFFKP
jgi:hypothetical protein